MKPFRATPGRVLLILFILGTSCRPASCTKEETERFEKVPEVTAEEEPLGESIVSLTRIGSWANTELFAGSLANDASQVVQTFFDAIDEVIVSEAALRKEGSIVRIDFKASQDSDRWAVLLPVDSVEAFLVANDARLLQDDGGESLYEWVHADRTFYALGQSVSLLGAEGQHVLMANFPRGALEARQAVESLDLKAVHDVQVYVWPDRVDGLLSRYGQIAETYEERLSTLGHDLLPARAGLASLQARLYRTMSNPSIWPSPVLISGEYRFRDEAFTHITLRAWLLRTSPPVEVVSSQLSKDSVSSIQGTDARAYLALHLQRRVVEDALVTLMPRALTNLVAARGTERMTAVYGAGQQFFAHNRGPTYLGFFEETMSLSPELYLRFEVADRDRVMESSDRFHQVLVEEIWRPFWAGLSEPSVKESWSTRTQGLRVEGTRVTFALPGADTNMGSCTSLHGDQFHAYYGVRPCQRLDAIIRSESEALTAVPLSFAVSLESLLDLVYVQPGQRLTQTELPEVEVMAFPRETSLELESRLTLEHFGKIIASIEKLQEFWNPVYEVDPGIMALRAGGQQSLYQDPGLLIVGPPGLLGALPPAYFLGLPFSSPPAPPSSLRKIYLDED